MQQRTITENSSLISARLSMIIRIWDREAHISEIADILDSLASYGVVDDVLSNLKILLIVKVEQHQLALRVIWVARDPVSYNIVLQLALHRSRTTHPDVLNGNWVSATTAVLRILVRILAVGIENDLSNPARLLRM